MDWLQKMNSAINYMEANLDNEIDLNKVGNIAGCNSYQFGRVFSYMANATPAEYIRRRRLTRAAFDLQGSDAKVIDVALRYGYDSPTSFTRAFSALHGITPNEAKKGEGAFVSYPPISFQISIKGVHAMNYRIETKEAFRMVGPRITTTLKDDQAFKDIPEFWGRFGASGGIGQLCSIMNTEPKGVFGLGISEPEGNSDNFYYIAVASTLPVPEGMYEFTVPASTWAIFEGVGKMPEAIQNLQQQIYTEWMPSSGYEYNAFAPDMEVYSDGNQQDDSYKFCIWLPVLKKYV